ncbi:acetate/propionate family kinase [Rhizobium sp. CG4]|uniref:acetate/propionate family kinase n=1 Tax=Rhizobium sp. CG4 TaxID=2726075 RepID=UPI0020343704|nr:acetate/propionate family kinase [Rhizobium sp. CG4]MCM2457088.1 acetate/propionate family kinase [Rhizobium sp. CG4]
MTSKMLLTFNAGSSTVKIGLFAVEADKATRVGKGIIDFRERPLVFHLMEGPQDFEVPLTSDGQDVLHDVLEETFGWLAKHFNLDDVYAVGHRVVHGGDRFEGPVVLSHETRVGIEDLTPLAPLHQPQSLRLIRAISHLFPDMPQTVSFDTAFHRSQHPLAQRFALPSALHDEGVRRYGFHGLSYKFIASAVKRIAPELGSGKVVAAHLGSGASLCALEEGISRDTSMGFSTLDGIPMATRCGALDAGVLLHLLTEKGMKPVDLQELLYHRCGLLGVSGVSADIRDLLKSENPDARLALDLFSFRIAGEAARLAATLGGLDAFVFTAGIGEHQPLMRKSIAERMMWLGVEIDDAANNENRRLISSEASRVAVYVISTDEEQTIADEALSVLSE